MSEALVAGMAEAIGPANIAAGVLGLSFLIGYKYGNCEITLDKNKKGSIKNWTRLIKKTRSTLCIATDFDPEIFENGEVLSAVLGATRRGVEIRFAYDTDFLPSSYQQLFAQRKIGIAKMKPTRSYFAVADRSGARVETHEPYGNKTALTYWGFPIISGKMEDEFEKFWNLASLEQPSKA